MSGTVGDGLAWRPDLLALLFLLRRGGDRQSLGRHSLASGLSWHPTGWRPTRFLVTAAIEPAAAVWGLVRDMRENPIGGLPITSIAS